MDRTKSEPTGRSNDATKTTIVAADDDVAPTNAHASDATNVGTATSTYAAARHLVDASIESLDAAIINDDAVVVVADATTSAIIATTTKLANGDANATVDALAALAINAVASISSELVLTLAVTPGSAAHNDDAIRSKDRQLEHDFGCFTPANATIAIESAAVTGSLIVNDVLAVSVDAVCPTSREQYAIECGKSIAINGRANRLVERTKRY